MVLAEPTVYAPPQLPAYLADTYELKPVTGVPTDEEVTKIHAVIRAMEAVSHVPALYNITIAMKLSQHLFNVQMVKYRNQYSYPLFPGEVIYTPPDLPVHMAHALALEPVMGFPSDDQIISARAAVKVSENLLNTPMFDAGLSMRLSQHLFNIQLARYIQDTAQTSSETTQPLPDIQTAHASQSRPGNRVEGARARNDSGSDSDLIATSGDEPGTITTEAIPTTAPELVQPPSPTKVTDQQHAIESPEKVEISQLLREVKSSIEIVNQVLVGTQNTLARGFNSHYHRSSSRYYPHAVINHKGEHPAVHGIPSAYAIYASTETTLSPALLAQSLRFYGIGDDLIEEGDELKLKPGEESKARSMLREHVL